MSLSNSSLLTRKMFLPVLSLFPPTCGWKWGTEVAWMGPWNEDEGRGDNLFLGVLVAYQLYPLSSPLRRVQQEIYNWLGSPLKFFLTHAKVGMGDMGQPLQMAF